MSSRPTIVFYTSCAYVASVPRAKLWINSSFCIVHIKCCSVKETRLDILTRKFASELRFTTFLPLKLMIIPRFKCMTWVSGLWEPHMKAGPLVRNYSAICKAQYSLVTAGNSDISHLSPFLLWQEGVLIHKKPLFEW